MSEEKRTFISFIAGKTDHQEKVIKLFEQYHSLLLEANKRVNLISRKVDPEKLWTFHFLDSLLPLAYNMTFPDKKVLDLGTGGGLPGIPLAIMNSSAEIHLLDSRGKKIVEVERIIKKLDLINCFAFCKRLEEVKADPENGAVSKKGEYDIIVSRSVLMTRTLIKKAKSLLNENGVLLLYKAKELEPDLQKYDCEIFDSYTFPWRERKIVIVR